MGGGGGGGSVEDVGSLVGAFSGSGEMEGLPGGGCEGGGGDGGEAAGWASRVAYSRYGSAVRWRVNWLRKTPMKALGVAGRNRNMLERVVSCVAHGLLCFGVARGVDKVVGPYVSRALNQHCKAGRLLRVRSYSSSSISLVCLMISRRCMLAVTFRVFNLVEGAEREVSWPPLRHYWAWTQALC